VTKKTHFYILRGKRP